MDNWPRYHLIVTKDGTILRPKDTWQHGGEGEILAMSFDKPISQPCKEARNLINDGSKDKWYCWSLNKEHVAWMI